MPFKKGAAAQTAGKAADRAATQPLEGLPPHRRIYINRNLRTSAIEAIGFDMDHTLAVYDEETFSRLCFDLAADLLVSRKGYPEQVRDIPPEGAEILP